jgi:ethanolamine utilization protein EutP (predicted NTPase)
MMFYFKLKYLINRLYALHVIETDLDFVRTYFKKEIDSEQKYRDLMAKLQEKKEVYAKKKMDLADLNKEISATDQKLQAVLNYRQKIEQLEKTKVELKGFIDILKKSLW